MDHPVFKLAAKPKKTVLGFMSGTSLDGMDAVLLEIEGCGRSISVKYIDFLTLPYSDELRSILMKAVTGEHGGSRLVCSLNFLLGEISLKAGLQLCAKAGIDPQKIDFAGSHGQTVYHLPDGEFLADTHVRSTLQIGEASVIAQGLGCPVVSDFRVRDLAAGGQGAPLVPYTEHLLYQSEVITRAFLNIGGIANITLLPAGGTTADILAFDTGPGNMMIDAAAQILTGKPRDENGSCAASGKILPALLEMMFENDSEYLKRQPPKSTGREKYNLDYVKNLLDFAKDESINDILATITRYSAETITKGINDFCISSINSKAIATEFTASNLNISKLYTPELAMSKYVLSNLTTSNELYVSGGGLHNNTLMKYLHELLPGCTIRTGNELGIPADAKEAAAFAILANEAIHGLCNNAPSATGANHPVVMGKISF